MAARESDKTLQRRCCKGGPGIDGRCLKAEFSMFPLQRIQAFVSYVVT